MTLLDRSRSRSDRSNLRGSQHQHAALAIPGRRRGSQSATEIGLAVGFKDRRPGEGVGPFKRLVVRGATLIDGTGAPPIGPVDIVIEKDRIVRVASVGYPKVAIREQGRPDKGDYEIDATGMYVLPGFIDAHAHIASAQQGLAGPVPPAEYVYKLWLGHGITTIREVGSFNGLRWT